MKALDVPHGCTSHKLRIGQPAFCEQRDKGAEHKVAKWVSARRRSDANYGPASDEGKKRSVEIFLPSHGIVKNYSPRFRAFERHSLLKTNKVREHLPMPRMRSAFAPANQHCVLEGDAQCACYVRVPDISKSRPNDISIGLLCHPSRILGRLPIPNRGIVSLLGC